MQILIQARFTTMVPSKCLRCHNATHTLTTPNDHFKVWSRGQFAKLPPIGQKRHQFPDSPSEVTFTLTWLALVTK